MTLDVKELNEVAYAKIVLGDIDNAMNSVQSALLAAKDGKVERWHMMRAGESLAQASDTVRRMVEGLL